MDRDLQVRRATLAVHAGLGEPEQGSALLAGPVFAGTYRHVGDPAGALYTYGRYTNPTWSAYAWSFPHQLWRRPQHRRTPGTVGRR